MMLVSRRPGTRPITLFGVLAKSANGLTLAELNALLACPKSSHERHQLLQIGHVAIHDLQSSQNFLSRPSRGAPHVLE
jgi:hypothetical protein